MSFCGACCCRNVREEYEEINAEDLDKEVSPGGCCGGEEKSLGVWRGREVRWRSVSAAIWVPVVTLMIIVGAVAIGETVALGLGKITWQRALLLYGLDVGASALVMAGYTSNAITISPVDTTVRMVDSPEENEML